MKRKAPPVRQFMTHLPVEAENCETAGQVIKLMEEHQIHHIPVMNGSQLVGVVSQTDLLNARGAAGAGFHDQPLQQICQTDVVMVSPVSPVNDVATEMLERAADSAVVVDGGFVVGIFTVTDALRCLADWEQL